MTILWQYSENRKESDIDDDKDEGGSNNTYYDEGDEEFEGLNLVPKLNSRRASQQE